MCLFFGLCFPRRSIAFCMHLFFCIVFHQYLFQRTEIKNDQITLNPTRNNSKSLKNEPRWVRKTAHKIVYLFFVSFCPPYMVQSLFKQSHNPTSPPFCRVENPVHRTGATANDTKLFHSGHFYLFFVAFCLPPIRVPNPIYTTS